METQDFRTLLGRARARDPEAAAQLVAEFEPHLRRRARLRLSVEGLRRLIDPLDVCQSVLGNFFVRAAAGPRPGRPGAGPGRGGRRLSAPGALRNPEWTKKGPDPVRLSPGPCSFKERGLPANVCRGSRFRSRPLRRRVPRSRPDAWFKQ